MIGSINSYTFKCNRFKFSTRFIACDTKRLASLNRSRSHRYYLFIDECVNDNSIINPAPYKWNGFSCRNFVVRTLRSTDFGVSATIFWKQASNFQDSTKPTEYYQRPNLVKRIYYADYNYLPPFKILFPAHLKNKRNFEMKIITILTLFFFLDLPFLY